MSEGQRPSRQNVWETSVSEAAIHKPKLLQGRRAARKGFVYPTEPPRAPGSVLGAEGRVRNRRRKHFGGLTNLVEHTEGTQGKEHFAPGQRRGQEWWEEMDISGLWAQSGRACLVTSRICDVARNNTPYTLTCAHLPVFRADSFASACRIV